MTKTANEAFVPSHGWVFFGGSILMNESISMKLESLNNRWTLGPDLYQSTLSEGQCVLQVSNYKQIKSHTER